MHGLQSEPAMLQQGSGGLSLAAALTPEATQSAASGTPEQDVLRSVPAPTPTSTAPLDDTALRALRIFHLYRMVVAALLLILYVADTGTELIQTLEYPVLFLHVNQLYAALVLASYTLSYAPRLPVLFQSHGAVLVDVLVLTVVMQASGGLTSDLNILLVPSIAAGGLLLPGRVALAYAALAFLAQGAVLLLRESAPGAEEMTRTGVLGSVFFITAIVTSLLADRARSSESLARDRAIQLAELARLNETIVQRMQTGLLAVSADQRIKLSNRAARECLDMEGDPSGRSLAVISAPLARQLASWLHAAGGPGGPAEQLDELPGLLVAFMNVGDGPGRDSVIFLERQSDAEARLQQVKLAAVGRLTAGIAHEIRNPLAAVSNAAQLLEESAALGPAEKRVAEIIRNNARRMNRIVENILQVSRREQARPRLLQLQPFLANLTEEFISTRPEHFERIAFSVEPSNLQIYFDPGHLHQVVWNLCQNACRHGRSANAGATIDLRAYEVGGGLTRVRLDVLDAGPGVPPGQEQKLFEPFFTTSSTGTGLGLYLSKELCEFNRAALHYLRRDSGGSCFRIIFSTRDTRDQAWPIELH
jgi:two-component system sensor histidine kinase PilS (NtrC family)